MAVRVTACQLVDVASALGYASCHQSCRPPCGASPSSHIGHRTSGSLIAFFFAAQGHPANADTFDHRTVWTDGELNYAAQLADSGAMYHP